MKITKNRIIEIIKEELNEAKKRDYKAEYKKFQSSTKSKKYRAELNKYNRQKGTYGNGDGKDASHKGGKIVGFEAESKNRGRAEKSRLKKEGIDVRKWIKAVDKGKDVVVYDKKGKRYNLQGGDNKSVQVTDHWEDAGRRNVHPEKTWQTLPLSKVKKIVTEGKLNEIATDVLLGQFGFDETGEDGGVIFYANKKAKLDAWYDGRKAMVGRMNGKDNKVFKDGDKRLETYLRKKFKLKSNWDESKLREAIREIIKEQLNEAKMVKLILPIKDRKKVVHILQKQLKLKITKDFEYGGQKGSDFVIELDKKFENKVIELFMKSKIKVRG